MTGTKIKPERLTAVMAEADRIARGLIIKGVDLNEAAKAIQFYAYSGMDRDLFERYLSGMANNPPPRSRRTRNYYRALYELWRASRQRLDNAEKGYAWSWAIRLARAGK